MSTDVAVDLGATRSEFLPGILLAFPLGFFLQTHFRGPFSNLSSFGLPRDPQSPAPVFVPTFFPSVIVEESLNLFEERPIHLCILHLLGFDPEAVRTFFVTSGSSGSDTSLFTPCMCLQFSCISCAVPFLLFDNYLDPSLPRAPGGHEASSLSDSITRASRHRDFIQLLVVLSPFPSPSRDLH